MKTKLFFAMLMLVSCSANAQSFLQSIEHPTKFDVADSLLTAGDIYTTIRCQHDGAQEKWAAWELGKHPGAVRVSLFNAAELVAIDYSVHFAVCHNHTRIARTIQFLRLGVEAADDYTNSEYLLTHRSQVQNTSILSMFPNSRK